MADNKPAAELPSAAAAPAPSVGAAAPIPDPNAPKPKAPNPAFKAMGLPAFRKKLPSRNWMIFLSITGAFSTAVWYDKRETRRAQKKWAKLVEHIAREPLDVKAMPRKLTIYIESPPGDGLRTAQEHYKEYVKPVLTASGLDWEFVQGREEGDIRAAVAEKIRNARRPDGEKSDDDVVAKTRQATGIQDFDGPLGDIVIGRHTWKEYLRGLHEGWLGPLTAPPQPEKPAPELVVEEPVETLPGITIHSSSGDDTNKTPEDAAKSEEDKEKEEKNKKKPRLPPFIPTTDYESAVIPTNLPAELGPSTPLTFPHILGFLNTPIRVWRFLHRRELADHIGRETAAAILGTYRPYNETLAEGSSASSTDFATLPQTVAEQAVALQEEEKQWHKSVHRHEEGEPERTWLDPVILDPRIASRMRRFELTPDEEARAATIVVTEEEIEGFIKKQLRHLWHWGRDAAGFGEPKPMSAAEQVEESLK